MVISLDDGHVSPASKTHLTIRLENDTAALVALDLMDNLTEKELYRDFLGAGVSIDLTLKFEGEHAVLRVIDLDNTSFGLFQLDADVTSLRLSRVLPWLYAPPEPFIYD